MSSPPSFVAALAAWMLRLREEKGISQETLATQLGKDQPYLSRLERGRKKISLKEFLEWAEALDLTWQEMEVGVRAAWLESGHRDALWVGPAPNW